ncbi:MAG: hypothetical protein IPM50_09255 [Acidobacteriota bacterium]|nr:MAG: hypothetical protein IPM50_09255 [Acidobacteriota bacterium]
MPSTQIENYGAKAPLEKTRPDLAVLTGVTAKDTHSVGRGDVIGVITASGLVRRRTRAAVTGTAFATNSPTGTVDDVTVFKVGDVIKNAAGATVGTIDAINTGTNTITLTGNAAVAVSTGANVFGSDGSQVAAGIADEGSNGTGDTPIAVFIAGLLDESLILRLDATAKTELGGATVAGGIFKF